MLDNIALEVVYMITQLDSHKFALDKLQRWYQLRVTQQNNKIKKK